MTVLAALATNALLARLLFPQDLGAYFLAFSVVLFGAQLGSLGLNQTVVRFVAESLALQQFGRIRRVVSLTVGLGALGALGIGLLYLLLGQLVGRDLFNVPALAAVTGLVAGWITVTALQTLLAETFRGLHDIRLATVFGGLMTGVLLSVCLALVWLLRGQATLSIVMLLAVGSGFTSALLAGWLLHRKVVSLPPQGEEQGTELGEILHVTWPLLITGVTLFALTQVDIWVLGAFRSPEEVAVYGAALRLVTLVAVPLLIVNAVVPPLVVEMYAQGKKRELEHAIRTTATLAGIPAALALIAFTLLGSWILGLVFGDYYREGAAVLALLSVGQLVNVWAGPCGITLMMTGHQVVMMGLTTVCGLITVAVSLAAVEHYGAVGVAVAAVAGLVLQNVSMWIAVKLITGMWTHIDFINVSKLVRSVW